MTIPRPVLDDVRYDTLLSEAVAALPALNPAWTDHNSSDPGITLLEVLAHVCDGLSWTLSRYERALTPHFAVLLGESAGPAEPAEAALRRAVVQLERVTRAVSGADVVAVVRGGVGVLDLPLEVSVPAGTSLAIRTVGTELTVLSGAVPAGAQTLDTVGPAPRAGDLVVIGGAAPGDVAEAVRVVDSEATPTEVLVHVEPALRRPHARHEPVRLVDPPVAETVLDVAADPGATALQWSPVPLPPRFVVQSGESVLGHAVPLSRVGVVGPREVVAIGRGGAAADEHLLQVVHDLLRRRAPAASRLSVRQAEIRVVDIDVAVVRAPAGLQRADALRTAVEATVRRHLDPVTGAGGRGWPFGLPLYRAALDDVIERVPGVDHVHGLAVDGDDASDVWPLSDTPAVAARSVVEAGVVDVAILDAEDGW